MHAFMHFVQADITRDLFDQESERISCFVVWKRDMAFESRLWVLLLVLLAINAGGVLGKHDQREHHHDEQGKKHRMFKDLKPQDARVEFESEGGRLEVWGGKGSGVFEEANVAACRTTLKPRGLWLPSYVDSPCMQLVTRGSGRVGIVTPFGDRRTQENTFKVEKGDVVAIPEGVTIWWYNGGDSDLEIVGVADVTLSPQPGGLRAFHLAGGKQKRKEDQHEEEREEEEHAKKEHKREGYAEEEREQAGYGAVIHGFSTDVLARAWDMKEDMVRELLEGQNEIGIIRVEEDITFPDPANENPLFMNFIYSLGKAHPDLYVEDGGELRELNSFKFPVLKYLEMGMECMHLEQGAMVAPNWFHNAHQVLYVLEGCGRLEVVHNNGERALDTKLNEGSLLVIPAFFPSTKIAADDERFHYISFVTSDRPTISYLAGRNSVYQGIPMRMLSRIFNVKEDVASRVQRAHEKEAIIFPGQGQSRGRESEGKDEEPLVGTM